MAKYIYNYSKELWYVNNGKSTIVKQGDLIKSEDIKYFIKNHSERILCIEEDPPKEEKDDLFDLKSIINDQSIQIQNLIDIIKSTSQKKEVVYISNGDKSLVGTNPDLVKLTEPEFRPSIKDINTDNITVVGESGDSLEVCDIGLKSKLSKLRKIKNDR